MIAAGFMRYLSVNDGSLFAYPYRHRTTETFQLNEPVEIKNCSGYYSGDYNDSIITTNSAEIITYESLLKKYNISQDNIIIPFDKYIEIELNIKNISNYAKDFDFSGMVVRGADWWTIYSFDVTGFANNSENMIYSYGQCKGIKIDSNSSENVNVLYGLHRSDFLTSSFENIDSESIVLVVTSTPVENRIRLFGQKDL